ncbi:hypothetical protein G8A07_05105 [Roseateles sp. DAIF2]|uniref:hypothetical protein n=1 Tax=Roseateles sp. DAIF2 TaxID=2714952 RepID=UPI0018A314E1|nr:hypothetical protein [Roseateles sp. DAIF2]QPF72372.1 hypothetical protein G8A07_05105 [Roseateles sp. DAIF2]
MRARLLAAVVAACCSVLLLAADAIAQLLLRSVEESARLEAQNLATAIARGASKDMQNLQAL